MATYNYGEFSPDAYDFNSSSGPDVGERAPNFQLTTTDGVTRDLLEFQGEFLVLELGSITCPLFQSRRSGMEPLGQDFPRVRSLSVAVEQPFGNAQSARRADPGARAAGQELLQACVANNRPPHVEERRRGFR